MKKSQFLISNIPIGRLNAMVKNIMTQTGIEEPEEAVRMMNSGELQVSVTKPKCRTGKTGIIRFSVISDGTTAEEWIDLLEVGDYVKSGLQSEESFKPTNGIIYDIKVEKGQLFCYYGRDITNTSEDKPWESTMPNVEVACLIRQKFSDKELRDMGLYFIIDWFRIDRPSEDRHFWIALLVVILMLVWLILDLT